MQRIIDRFLKYVQIDTQSDPDSKTTPSTEKQWLFAEELVEELQEIGLEEVTIDDNAYVMATLPSNLEENGPGSDTGVFGTGNGNAETRYAVSEIEDGVSKAGNEVSDVESRVSDAKDGVADFEQDVPVIGFISHFDTSPDFSGTDVNPQIIENYDGEDIVLNALDNIVLSPDYFEDLLQYKGQTLITTDGTTLLGADDKAGITEIVTAMEYLIDHPEIKHGKIRIGFTPDEEIGRGAHHFDVDKFGADWAYTMDGSQIGELEYENFNAAKAKVVIKGKSVHPGYAKDKMVNAISIATEFLGILPPEETPERTSGREGFFHVHHLKGEIEHAEFELIIRDHDEEQFKKRKQLILDIGRKLNELYRDCIDLVIEDQYTNMRQRIEPVMHIVDIAREAMESVDVTPIIKPIRGGTDGSQLSYMGLPCPNIFAGGHNFHGKYEYVPVESMQKAVEVIVKICELVGARGRDLPH